MDVGNWLAGLGFADQAESFSSNGIDADLLPELTSEDLKELGILRLADRKRLLKAIVGLSEAVDDASGGQTPDASPEAEHRQVAVLFADLAGYTQLTSELGSEKTRVMLNLYFETVDAIVQSYGGTVDKHIGDNVMAVFGAPIAHDDDFLRAARTALDIHERMETLSGETGRRLQAHIGIAGGRVLAGGIGSDSHREYTVTGDAVNLAARLQDMAQPRETLISEAFFQATTSELVCSSLGDVTLKGINAPVGAWRIENLRDVRDAAPGTVLVGRQTELMQFVGAAKGCLASGRGQLIVVRGEAGIGKTRLVEEFTSVAGKSGFAMHRALVFDFGVGERSDAVRSIARSLLDIPENAGKSVRQAAADRAVEHGTLLPEQRVFLNDILNLASTIEDRAIYDAMDNSIRIDGKRAVICDLIRGLSTVRPLVIFVEDVHWSTPLILTYLSSMAATVAGCPALLIVTSRIDGFPLDEGWRGATGGCPLVTFDLGPLRQEDAVKLANSFIDQTNKFATDCIRRAQGNPLFLEQLLRHAKEHAGQDVPASIQSLVLARVDRLSPSDKKALQMASVLGQRFSLDALRDLAGDAGLNCNELVRRQLVRPEGDGFLFAHALVQGGVYASLPTAHREQLHRQAAEWFEGRDPILRAEHLDRANDPSAAGAYLDAARTQSKALHFETVLRLVDRGIELVEDAGVRCDLMCLRGDALRDTGATEESIGAFQSALESATDDVRRCRAWIGLAAGLRVADHQSEALEILDKAGASAARQGLIAEQAEIHYLRGNVYFPLGNFEGCLEEHSSALKLSRKAGSARGEALALGGLGDAYYLSGQMRSACEQFRSCVEVCRQHGYGRIEVANRHMIGWARIHLMEFEDAHEDALQATKMAADVSHHRARVLGLMLAGRVELELEQLTQAGEHMRQGIDLARTIGASNFEAQLLVRLAKLAFIENGFPEARELAETAVGIVRNIGMAFIGPTALAMKAALCEDPGTRLTTLAEAEQLLDTGCVAHNQIWFAEIAIDDALAKGCWGEAERYANRLETYTRPQPLDWPDFLIARARALAARGKGKQTAGNSAEIRRLYDLAVARRAILTSHLLADALEAE